MIDFVFSFADLSTMAKFGEHEKNCILKQ